jgi:hypothetical protein
MPHEHKKNELVIKRKRLQILQEQRAIFGYNTKPEIILEIQELESEIQDLETKVQKQPKDYADTPPREPDFDEPSGTWKAGKFVIGILAGIFVIILIGLAFSILFIPDSTPIVKKFSIELPEQETILVTPGSVIEIGYGKNAYIRPIIAEGNSGQLTWFIARGNKQLIDQGIKYIAPDEGGIDVLTVLVESSHGTQETYASLHIIVIHD